MISQLRGDYYQSPTTTETSTFPRYTTTTDSRSTTKTSSDSDTTAETRTTTETSSDDDTVPTVTTVGEESSTGSTGGSSTSSTSGRTTTDTVLPYPDSKKIQQKGDGGIIQTGLEYKGLGAYQNSEEITANDLQYLTALIQTYLFLQGVYIVPPSEAEIDVYVTVDVFGTVRTRVEWFLANNEILRAKTSFEVMAVDHLSGRLMMPPTAAAAEAEYNEQYILWAGPIIVKKTLTRTEPLLSDFTDVHENGGEALPAEQNASIPYPFKHQMKQLLEKD